MKQRFLIAFTCILFLLSSPFLLGAGDKEAETTKVRILIVPKFEIGEISGDVPGEAQLFYEYYCAGCRKVDIPNSTPTAQFYYRSELEDPDSEYTWFPLDSLSDYSIEPLNSKLYDKVYPLVRDCPLRTTETTKRVLADNFPGEEWAERDPAVLKGTTVTSDSYWKGRVYHENAGFIAEYYGCPDEYAVTEMEETGIMNAAECFGLEDRVISLRVIVNMDTFLKEETPERLWLSGSDYSDRVTEENSETVDIFVPGMENLFDVGKIVIDTVLAGEL